MEHRLPGLPPTDLLGYLVGLGLARTIARQAPGTTRWCWDGDVLVLDMGLANIPEFLVNEYRPTPVLNPWNNGSGYAPQDTNQRKTLDQLLSGGERVADIRVADAIARDLVVAQPSPNWNKERGAKEEFLRQLRNRWPDAALDWLDAAVVLTTGGAEFPPILGSGGNDGRLDFSSNFHTHLNSVLPEVGADRPQSLAWARSLLDGVRTGVLSQRTVGQFDASGAGTPRTGTFGAGRALVNPWAFILMLEGCLLFAAAPARRLGETGGRAAFPFTVAGSPDGPAPASHSEAFRGELWAPVWSAPSRLDEVEQVFSEARATWDGVTAVRAAQMYGAVRSFGADRRIDRFVRYGFVQRNGLAYVAVRLDDVRVAAAPGIELAIPAMRRAGSLRVASTQTLDRARRVFDAKLADYLRHTRPLDLLQLLAALTRWELAVTRSRTARDKDVRLRDAVRGSAAMAHLAPLHERLPEVRVGAALASGRSWLPTGVISTRAIVLGNIPDGRDREWTEPHVEGLGSRPLVDVLSDASVWCEQHGAGSTPPGAQAGRGVRVASQSGYRIGWQDVHAWSHGDLDDDLIEQSFLAHLSLQGPLTLPDHADGKVASVVPLPELALLQAFNSGDVRVPGESAETAIVQGLRSGWLLRLRADRTAEVLQEATDLLNRSRLHRGSRDGRARDLTARVLAPLPTARGPRLAAAMMASSRSWPAFLFHADPVDDPNVAPGPTHHLDYRTTDHQGEPS